MQQIHITTGDPKGIGWEISLKALKKIKKNKNTQFILWRKNKDPQAKFSSSMIIKRLHTLEELKNFKTPGVVEIASPLSPTEWVVQAVQHCLKDKKNRALTTGPLSKTQMQKDGFKQKGHTELLRKLSHAGPVFMMFLGAKFNVVLLTGHKPLKKISLNLNTLKTCLKLSSTFINTYFPHTKKPIGLLGLNPHAGEEGLLGQEEIMIKKFLKSSQLNILGPLVPDTAFLKKEQKRFCLYISLYHDQGLIPFKMAHERQSSALSLGLPFVRTSVSHGTAKDIFNKNKAVPDSMERALKWALKGLKTRAFRQ